MKRGGSSSGYTSNGSDEKKPKASDSISPLSAKTLSKLQKNALRRRLCSSTRYIIHDNSSPGYGWLLPGWLAEERHMESGRVYRYYYDPLGRLYKTRQQVILAWEKAGIIVIDK